ncbi:hypothetical protein [Vibrio sp. S9_S30]|uniref:hypothetical protein n=1 Tax=Vibrio sp. S9_S30 TaxID=2720226 RepID=UPI001931B4D9|nr:hypothetical protein [Vibrio sp. S9_S30]
MGRKNKNTSPASFVQIRDITLSGMMFVLFNLGTGVKSIDLRRGYGSESAQNVDWNTLGLLLRFSLGLTFIMQLEIASDSPEEIAQYLNRLDFSLIASQQLPAKEWQLLGRDIAVLKEKLPRR